MHPIDLSHIALFPGHLRIFSGRLTAGSIEETPGGIADLHSPPFAAPGFRCRFHLRDDASGEMARDIEPRTPGYRHMLLLQRGSWLPDRLVRESVYHRPLGGKPFSFIVRHEMIALPDRPALLIEIERQDLRGTSSLLSVVPEITVPALARLAPGKWTWFRPDFRNDVREIAPLTYEGERAWLRVRATAPFRSGGFLMPAPSGGRSRIAFLFEFLESPPSTSTSPLDEAAVAGARAAADRAAQRRETWLAETFPKLASSDERLDRWYARSVTSALGVRWEHPQFVLNPFFSAAGIDGGGVCSYLWDAAYISRLMPLLADRDTIRNWLLAFLRVGPEHHFAFDPFDGQGIGPTYALNAYALTRLVREYVAHHQDWSLLAEAQPEGLLLERLEQLAAAGKPTVLEPLLDYGETIHLLEMRTSGYEGIVPSPNAERIWILRFLAEVRERLGLAGAQRLREKAASIARALDEYLWDSRAGWFACRSADGEERELVYSVQVLTLLGLEFLAPDKAALVAAHVRDGKFLGPCGLHSVALDDRLHYESGDVDWGGGGSYVGQGPLLALDLYRLGELKRAETLLRRLLWWAEVFPYFPQSIRADRPSYCDFDRANCLAALSGAEAVITGLCGLEPRLDGNLGVRPWPFGGRGYRLEGYHWGGHTIDLEVDGQRYKVNRDGRAAHEGPCGEAGLIER
ncbi:MAG: hypothetical protein AB1486_19310 [Planctomycetota bacterium]